MKWQMWMAVIAMLWTTSAISEDSEEWKMDFKAGQHQGLLYRAYYPDTPPPENGFPLIVFLHGAGERGDDNERQLIHPGHWLWQYVQQQPAVVILPQAPEEDYWAVVNAHRDSWPYAFDYPYTGDNNLAPTASLAKVMTLLQHLDAELPIDSRRRYLLGLSMGGMGTLELLGRKPDYFAAAIAICGGANPAITKQYSAELALRLYHGLDDKVVLAQYSIDLHKALLQQGKHAELTLLPDTGHNSWSHVFSSDEPLNWLLSQRRPRQ